MTLGLAMGGASNLFGSVSTADAAVAAILFFSAIIGFWSGFVWQVVRILTLFVCLGVTLFYAPVVAASLPAGLSGPVEIEVAAVAVFVTTLTVCYLISFLFRDLVNALKPQLTDRILGAVFGLLKGAFIVAIVALLVLRYAAHESPVRARLAESKSATAMGTFLWYALPDKVREETPRSPHPSEPAPEASAANSSPADTA